MNAPIQNAACPVHPEKPATDALVCRGCCASMRGAGGIYLHSKHIPKPDSKAARALRAADLSSVTGKTADAKRKLQRILLDAAVVADTPAEAAAKSIVKVIRALPGLVSPPAPEAIAEDGNADGSVASLVDPPNADTDGDDADEYGDGFVGPAVQAGADQSRRASSLADDLDEQVALAEANERRARVELNRLRDQQRALRLANRLQDPGEVEYLCLEMARAANRHLETACTTVSEVAFARLEHHLTLALETYQADLREYAETGSLALGGETEVAA